MSIKILVDSASDISKEEAEELGIDIIPLLVTIGDKDYLDGLNLSKEEFYNILESNKELPKTSQINPYRFEEEFERLTSNGDDVLCITLSSNLSGTCVSAISAAEKFNGKVHVVDSYNVALGEKLLVLYALNLIKEGMDILSVVNELESVKSRIKILAVVDTLEYLKKGGRISAATAFAGELLNIKPIVSIVDGKVEMIGKVRGSKKAFRFIDEYVINCNGIDLTKPFGVLCSGNDSSKVNSYINHSKGTWNELSVKVSKLGCTIGSHVGPGAVGIAFFEPVKENSK